MREKDNPDPLERELRRLAEAIAYPPTPSLAAAVRRRLEEAAARPAPLPFWRLAAVRGFAAALAVALLAFALTLGISGGAREAVADFFGRIRIFQTQESPANLPREVSGRPASLDEAGHFLGTPIRLPTQPEGIGAPDRVLLQQFGEFRAVVLEYLAPRPPFLLFATSGFIGKGLALGEAPKTVEGLGEGMAFWLEGLHIVEYYDTAGNVIQESRRAAANTLIWQQGGLTYRLEGNLSLDDALKIAESLR